MQHCSVNLLSTMSWQSYAVWGELIGLSGEQLHLRSFFSHQVQFPSVELKILRSVHLNTQLVSRVRCFASSLSFADSP